MVKVTIRSAASNTNLQIEVGKLATIGELKNKIEEKTDIEPERQRYAQALTKSYFRSVKVISDPSNIGRSP
jgi:hypothetical protein